MPSTSQNSKVSSGENIYPEEIEAVINQSPYVDDSLVYGDGKCVAALVQLKPDVLAAFVTAVQDGVSHAEQTVSASWSASRKR